jgi:UDP-N-acetylglucosamine 2-epimerase (non-hydrolysing)
MKLMTIIGTRPEIIRLSLLIPLLDEFCQHILVHTGQNYDDRLSQIFFDELRVRKPDVHMGVRAAGCGEQIGQILARSEALFLEHRPDRLLILGDTNSGLAAIIARRLGIAVYHMEAGNRCYDDRVPEEINRRLIDHSSSVLMPYTNRSRENLLAEGFPGSLVHVTGNPIYEVLEHYKEQISSSSILHDLHLERGKYFLLTAHRAENVDIEDRLKLLVQGLTRLRKEFGFPVVGSLHPRTESKIKLFGIYIDQEAIRFLPPMGFFDFVHLEQNAFCTLTDSGTVQEETCLFRVPNVTIRDVTERPETLECGSNILTGVGEDEILRAVAIVSRRAGRWAPPEEYLRAEVSSTVVRILLGFRLPRAVESNWQSSRG